MYYSLCIIRFFSFQIYEYGPDKFFGAIRRRVPLVYCYCFLKIKVERTESLLRICQVAFRIKVHVSSGTGELVYSTCTLGQ